MSIILKNRIIPVLVLGLLFFGTAVSREKDSTFRIVAHIGGGISHKTSEAQVIPDGYENLAANGFVRLMWEPDHILNVGMESGLVPVSSFEQKDRKSGDVDFDANVRLFSVPVLLVFSMQKWDFELAMGMGFYNLVMINDIKLKKNTNIADVEGYSSEWNMGAMISLGYNFKFSEGFAAGAALKTYSISERSLNMVSFQIFMKISLFSW